MLGASPLPTSVGADPAIIRTFLFTDIEGSTRTWQSAPDGMASALERHDALLRDTVGGHGGTVVKHTGDGVLAVFSSPRAAAAAAVEAQRALRGSVPFSVRMAVSTGEARPRGEDWFGPALNRGARLLEAGNGGQILVSAASAALLRDLPMAEGRLDNLGDHRLRDLQDPQPIYQLTASGLAERHPPLRAAAAPIHTVPATRTPLVGRNAEVEELIELLDRTRLLTITGVGGVGKTRVAIEVASRILARFPGGVFFTELASVTTSSGVADAVLRATGAVVEGGSGGSTIEDHLVTFLVPREALVVLDNCEHLLDECARIVDSILDSCPHVKVLTTSRESLAVDGERVWRVPSLASDEPDSDAVRLFLDRAAADVTSSLTDDDLARITGVCRDLDGIPLAIELAAAQTAHLSIEEIAARLSDRFALLTGGRRRVQRQQTLHATVDWSHDLLADDERQLLRRLAVFPSWFDVAALEAVCGWDPAAPSVRVLGALVSKSLVESDPRHSRYRLLETIRLYAEDRLIASGEAEGARERHCEWVFDAVHRLGDTAGRTFDAVEVMMQLLDDLRAALQWSAARGDLARAAHALAFSGTLWWFSGRNSEGLAWLDVVERGELPASLQCDLLGLRAALLIGRGDPAAVVAAAEAARRASQDETSSGRLQADVIVGLMLLTAPDAHDRFEEIIRRAARADDDYFFRQARDYRAHLLFAHDPPAAIAEWADLVATADPNRRGIADFFALLDLGGGCHLTGDDSGALAAADELDRRGFSIARGYAGTAAQYLRTLAFAGLGDVDGARNELVAFRDETRRTPAALGATDCAVACAATLVAGGEIEDAARVLGAARGIGSISMTPISFAVHRHYTLLVRERLPDGAGRRLYDDARASDPSALVDATIRRWTSSSELS